MSNLDFAIADDVAQGASCPPPSITASAPPGFDLRGARLAGALDEVDYGVVLLTGRDRIHFANRAALAELASAAALRVFEGRLRTARSLDACALERALGEAESRGLRHMLVVGHGEHRLALSVVPLPNASLAERSGTVVMLGKRQVCHPLSIAGYSRFHGLTAAEGRVLAELCNGAKPQDAARHLAVSISTVRTQIASIRAKTGAASIFALLRQLAVLPPVLVALGRFDIALQRSETSVVI